MRKRGYAILLTIAMLISSVSMTGCGTSAATTAEPTATAAPTSTPEPTKEPATEPTTEPAATEAPEPTTEPVAEPTVTSVPEPTKAPVPVAEGNPRPFRSLTAQEMVAEMGTGWNLGNTMDGHTGFTPSETAWQSVVTTKELIQAVHDAGFNTVRIPVTWGNMIDDENGYLINEKWISRVQDIVDYCVSQDMYAIINIHHDGAEQSGWLRIAAADPQPVYEKFEAVWRQIADYFKDYDEHLIFESMNEVTGGDDSNSGILRDMEVIMKLNQIFVDTVRQTGSNNTKRWLSVPARYTNITNTCKNEYGFTMPKDEAGHLFLAVHYYDWTFGLQDNLGVTKWTLDKSKNVQKEFEQLKKFTEQGYPVILGEYGCVDKNNTEERAYHVETVNVLCKKLGIVPCLWDIGWYDRSKSPDYSFSMFDRNTCELLYPEIVAAIMRGTFLENKAGIGGIDKPETVTELTDITLSETCVTMTIGENKVITAAKTPENSNDIILWKTADDSVATVYNGNVRARGIGTTTLTAYSQSGSVWRTVEVTVLAQTSEHPCTKIKTASSIMTLGVSGSANLEAEMSPENTDAFLTYKSTNEAVVTVNEHGKIVGTGAGVAYIIITASTGLTKSVKVKVSAVSASGDLSVALNIYYNDNAHSYYGNDYGAPVTITGNGQYTLTFDCATDLSDAAKKAGVESLTGAGAIYIKDHAVTLLQATKTTAQSCKIRYDKIVVDGTELTITNSDFKEAVKSSGVLDTGDPMNAWDGSAVAEAVANSDYTLTITGVTNPKKIEVTFTIDGLVFASETTSEDIALEGLEVLSETALSMKIGETKEVQVKVTPGETTEKIAFVASDASVVAVDCTAREPENGIVTVTITCLSEGSTTVTATGEGTKKAKVEITGTK
ncbi:MAG: cellulase family glycosylhydrolase [Lachnospiraceae bacterium]